MKGAIYYDRFIPLYALDHLDQAVQSIKDSLTYYEKVLESEDPLIQQAKQALQFLSEATPQV